MTNPQLMVLLRELPPLFPQFLQRRRLGLTVVGDLLGELGIERPVFFTLVHIDMTQGIYAKEGVTLAEMRAYDPYSAIDRYSGPVGQLVEQGLVHQDVDGTLTLSAQARAAVDRLHTEATDFVAHKTPISPGDLAHLAHELRRCADALAANPALMPHPGSHLMGYQSLSRYGDHSAPMVRIEQAIGELWGARDDAHMAAWRAADLEGPPFDVLSHVWSGTNTLSALSESLKIKQTPDDLESSLTWLVEREYVELDGDTINLTPLGVMIREDIEHETNRLYFASWPQTREEAAWTRDTLKELIDRLVPNQVT